MTFLKTSRSKKTNKNMVSVQEAYSIWKLLSNRYRIVDNLLVQNNFVHDRDFKLMIDQDIKNYKAETNFLKKEAEKYSIIIPKPNINNVNAKGNSEVTLDSQVAWMLYHFKTADIAAMLKILRDTTTNDPLRAELTNLVKKSIKSLFNFIDYLALKGWMDVPPLYPYVPENVEKRITVNEVYYIWEHLIFRNTNIHQTKLYSKFVYDKDLKIVFDMGLRVLKIQRTRLEKLLTKYGVVAPHAFADATTTLENTEVFTDKFMFWNIFNQMKNAAALHSQAFFGAVINQEVRKIFYDFTTEEIDLLANLVKYGKTKGWIIVEPHYKMG